MGQANNTNTTTSSNAITPSDQHALAHQMKVSSTWVHVMIAAQLLLSASVWYQTYFLFLITHTLFVAFGIAGVQRRSKCLLFSHFVYSSALSFLIMFMFCFSLMGGFQIPFFVIAFGLAFLLIQSVGMRHERGLLAMISVMEELNTLESNVEAGIPSSPELPPTSITYTPVPEERLPFLSYDNHHPHHHYDGNNTNNQVNHDEVININGVPLSEEEQIQMFAEMEANEKQQIQNQQNQQQQQFHPTSNYVPQYPFLLPPHFPDQQQQPGQPFVYVPYQVSPFGEQQAQYMYPPYAYPQMTMPYVINPNTTNDAQNSNNNKQ